MAFIYVSKLDSASRQLHTAVKMFLQNSEPVSIHTLACASQEILESLCKTQGIKSLKTQILEFVREERKKDFIKMLDKAKNSFKHAGIDPNETTKFNSEETELILWDAIRLYHNLTKEKVSLFVAFELWMYANNTDLFILVPEQKQVYESLIKGFDPQNRGLFLQMVPEFEQASKN